MQNLMNTTTTMTSKEILELLNANRVKPMELKELHRDIKRLFPAEIESGMIPPTLRPNGQVLEYHLPEIESKMLVATKDSAYLRQITEYWVNRSKAQTLPQTLPEALRAYADEVEAHGETKVQLESTSKELEHTTVQLEVKTTQLDESKEYFSIKRVAANNAVNWSEYSWRKLKATGAPIVKIFDANYGVVNAYHLTAWKLAYPEATLPF